MPLQNISKTAFPQLFSNAVNCQLLSLIRSGKENGIHLRELTKITGLSDRVLRKTIEGLRRSGVVICTDCLHGYFYPDNGEELRLYILQEERRGKSTLYTLSTAKSLYRRSQEDLQL